MNDVSDTNNPGPSRGGTGVFDIRTLYTNAAGYKLFMNGEDSDVSFRVEWKEITWHLPAHKLVLISMSDVFRRMFNTDMAERQSGEITVTDTSPLIVRQFLKYLYMGTLDFNGWMQAVELLKIAHMYGVNPLVALLEEYLTTAITFTNVCFMYETSLLYSLENLEKKTTDLILGAAFIVTATDGFLNLEPLSFEYFLKSNTLNMENECCVLSTLREWAVVNCSKRGVDVTRVNILEAMKPFMKFINWSLIPEQMRTFVPDAMVKRYENLIVRRKNAFQIVHPLLNYISCLKFMIQLGSYFADRTSYTSGMRILTFSVDNHAFVAGFKILGLFKKNALPHADRHFSITLGRDNRRSYSVFDCNSLPWVKGATIGDYSWLEMTAYLPYPFRIHPFGAYTATLRYQARRNAITMWPSTVPESSVIASSAGNISFSTHSDCFGITHLFILPAPPPRNVNDF